MAEHLADDAILVRRALGGDREAFGELVGRYERVLGALCRQKLRDAAEAEDVVQEAFLKAYTALDSLKDPERFGPWLYGIAFRAAVDQLRRRGRTGRVLSLDRYRAGGGNDPADPTEDAHEKAQRREQAERVLDTLGELPVKYRLVLTLRYQRQMAYKEIAAHLGEPAGTVANRLHRAMAMLKDRLQVRVDSSPDIS